MKRVLFFVFLVLSSCGLPDIIPPMEDPSVDAGTISGEKAHSQDFAIFGLLVFYKFYDPNSSPNNNFDNDFQTWRLRAAEDQQSVAASLGYRLVTVSSNPWLTFGYLPVIELPMKNVSSSETWTVDYTSPTSSSSPIMEEGSDTYILKRLVEDNSSPGSGKLFSSFVSTDADMSKMPVNTTALKVSFVIMTYGFSVQYGNVYSSPIALDFADI